MNGWIESVNAFSEPWGQAMLRALWQGGVALLAAWGFVALLAGRNGRVQCWLWRLAYLKFVACLLILAPLTLPLLPAVPVSHAGPAVRVNALPPDDLRISPPALFLEDPSGAPPAVKPVNVASHIASAHWSVASVLLLLWIPGAMFCLARVAIALNRTRRVRRGATRISDSTIRQLAAQMARQQHIEQVPQLLSVESLGSPLLMGIFRPAIVLPSDLPARCTHEQLRLILAHELAHLKRCDLLWNSFQSFVSALFFFHPLVWLTRRPWRLAQELACDDAAITATQASAVDYGQTLLDLLTHQQTKRRALLGVGVAESAGTLRRRLIAMKCTSHWSQRRLATVAAAAAIVGILGIIPWRVVAQEAPPSGSLPAVPATAARASPADAGKTDSSPPPVLAGVVKEGDDFRAVLEVTAAGGARSTVVLRKGDILAWDNSKVMDVTADSIRLAGGSLAAPVVKLGNNLRNESASTPSTADIAARERRGAQALAQAGNPMPVTGGGGGTFGPGGVLRPQPKSADTIDYENFAMDKKRAPVFVGADPSKIEISDKVITQVIPLQHMDAVKLRSDIAPVLSADSDVAVNQNSNSLIITDTSAKVHRVVEIVAALDQAAANRPAAAGLPADGHGAQGNAMPEPAAAGGRLLGLIIAATADMRAPMDGALVSVEAKEGQAVKKGDILFKLDSRELQLKIEIDVGRIEIVRAKLARAALEGNQKEIEAELRAEEIILNSDKMQLESFIVRAPFDGVVTSEELVAGQYITHGTLLTKVVNTTELRVDAQVPATQAASLHVGQKFTFQPSGFQNADCKGEISYISPIVDAATETVTIRGRITESAGSLKPGMGGDMVLPEK